DSIRYVHVTGVQTCALPICGLDEVLIVDPAGRPMPERAIRCADERAALDAFRDRVAAFDPDVLTGWNTIDFDLTVLQRIAERLPIGRAACMYYVHIADVYVL